MASKQQDLRVNINLTAKEAEKFLDHFSLKNIFDYIVSDPKVEQLYATVRDLENSEFPKTMTARTKSKNDYIYKNFDEFKKIFDNFVTRFLISEFFKEFSKFPFRAPSVIAERLEKRKEELLTWTISCVFTDLQARVYVNFLNMGQQPFNIF